MQLVCIERGLSIGDVVKRASSVTGETGVVAEVRTFATVRNPESKFVSRYVDTRRLK